MKQQNIYTEKIRPEKNKRKNNIYLQEETQKTFKQKLLATPKETALVLYDTTYMKNKKEGHTVYVNDHLNKTGKNPLRGKSHIFLDLTQLYTHHPKGKTTTCLGSRYEKNKKNYKYPSSHMCTLAIELKARGFLNITGKLINYLK